MCFAACATAQTPEPLPLPNVDVVTNGIVSVMARQPDGGVILGGTFTSVDGSPRKYIARLLPDGELDPAWVPTMDSVVTALAVDASGDVYVAGFFSAIDGQSRSRLAKLSGSASGALDPMWNPGADGTVNALAIDGDALYVGGAFLNSGGQPRTRIAKLSSTGAGQADPAWNASANQVVRALVADGNGGVYVGGDFTQIGGQSRNRVARLSGATGVAEAWNPSANGRVSALQMAADGAVFAGGEFTSIGGSTRQRIAKLSGASGVADALWNPGANAEVRAIALDGNGRLYVSGSFFTIGGVSRQFVARLDADGAGAADPAWNPSPNNAVHAFAMVGDRVYVGGAFQRVGTQPRLALFAVDASATLLASPDVERAGRVSAIAVQPNGGIIVGGYFYKAGGLPRDFIARVRPDGSIDTEWDPSADNLVMSLAVDASGAVFVGGAFSTVGGRARARLAKLDGGGSGAVDATWNPAPDSTVYSLALDGNGLVLAGGGFGSIGGQPRSRIARLAPGGAGAADPGWNAGVVGTQVSSIAVAPDNGVVFGGEFSQAGGLARSNIARMGADGTVDATWNPAANASVEALVIDGGGDVYAGGWFTTIGGQPRRRIARIAGGGAGVVDPAWDPNAGAPVAALAIAGSAIYAGGQFPTMGGLARGRMARIDVAGTGVVDPQWNPAPDNIVLALAVDATGTRLLAGGDFSVIGGQPRAGLAGVPLRVSYTLEYAAGPFGSIDGASPQIVEHGASGTAVGAVPDTGYHFVQWSDGSTANPRIDANVTANISVTAQFASNQYTLSYTAGAHGSISGTSPQTVNHGDSGTPVTAVPESHYAFVQWSDGSTANPRIDADVTASLGVSASFASQAPTIATAPAQMLLEDSGITSLVVRVSDAESPAGALVLTVASSDPSIVPEPSISAGDDAGERVLVLAPVADANGDLQLTLTLTDPTGASSQQLVAVRVTPVNDAPVPSLGASPSHPANTRGAQSVPGFASVDVGPPDEEASQSVQSFLIDDLDDPSGVVQGSSVAIALDGTLSYTLTGVGGTVDVIVRARDDGGTANEGVDTSIASTFEIHVAPGADLGITKDNQRSGLVPGETTTYAVVVTNAGPNAVSDAEVLDLLPPTLRDGLWACMPAVSTAPCPTPAAGSGNLSARVELAPGQQLRFDVSAVVNASTEPFVINTATVSAPAGILELDAANNSATDEDPILPDGIFRSGFEGP